MRRWCAAGTHLIVTSSVARQEYPHLVLTSSAARQESCKRYSTFEGTQLVASFTLSAAGNLISVAPAAAAIYFAMHDRPAGLLVADRSGAILARHAVAWISEYTLHLSSSGSLLFLSEDHDVLSICSATGSLRSIRLLGGSLGYRAACSSWGGLASAVVGSKCKLHFVDLDTGRLVRTHPLDNDIWLEDRPMQELSLAQGMRSVAVGMFFGWTDQVTVDQVTVLSTLHGNVLFKVMGRLACWDVTGNFLAVTVPPNSKHCALCDGVSVHDGMSGACMVTWSMQPVPHCVGSVVSLRWLPSSASLLCELHYDDQEAQTAEWDPTTEVELARLAFDPPWQTWQVVW